MRVGLLIHRSKADPIPRAIRDFVVELANRACEVAFIVPDDDCFDLRDLSVDCDFYVSKASSEPLLALAGILHDRGATLFNSFPASSYLRDKARVTAALMDAGVPVPGSCIASSAGRASEALGGGSIIIKPIRGANSQGIEIAESRADLVRINGGPHFAQTYDRIGSDDLKVYVIGDDVFVLRGKAPVAFAAPAGDRRPALCTPQVREIALAVARMFDLVVCGIDIVETTRGLAVVDVNSFPSFSGVPRAGERLADCLLARAVRSRRWPAGPGQQRTAAL